MKNLENKTQNSNNEDQPKLKMENQKRMTQRKFLFSKMRKKKKRF